MTKADIAELRSEMRSELTLLEQRMTIRLGGMLVAMAGVIIAVIRYLPGPHP